ncbi:hypothetical protein ARMGADRAFT_1093361 [Armillaria gallica]|uniref:Uncharacterized protein n=1 Tax=Armillaria gallica TaxID=47427 RepID=A0A2H3CR29_ARMGA|nr:hypothetical protein ARMGADRAFT_1093361 [Armillaria gallica]
MSGIDACLKIARLTAAAGEMAPFPFIKGAAQCVIVVLEAMESASKNRQDLQELAESIVTTLVVVRDTVIAHGPTSASCFKDIRLDFQTYLNDLLSKLNKEGNSSGIRRLLKAKKISEDISAYRQRLQTAKDNFLIRTMTMTHLTLSDVRGDVIAGFSTLTGSVEASKRNITSIKDNIEEIRTLGVHQNENMENLSTRLLQASRQRGIYKEMVWDIIPGDIRVIKRATRPSKCYRTCITYKDSYCTVENSNTPKIIREYQARGNDGEDAMDMEALDQALDFFIKQRHPNLPQIFGVCRSPDLPGIIFHGTTRVPLHHHLHGLSATRFIQFFSESFQDLQSISEVLPMESYRYLGDKFHNYFHPDNEEEQVYVNEYGKLVFGDLLCYTYYYLGPSSLSYTQEHDKYRLHRGIASRASGNPLHSRASRRISSSSLWKGDLQHCYEVIAFCHRRSIGNRMLWTQTFDRHRLQPPQYELNGPSDPAYHCPDPKDFYVPGSILCNLRDLLSPCRVLVGRARPPPHGWEWDISLDKEPSRVEVVNLSFDNGSVSLELSWDDVIRNPFISIHTRWEDSDEFMKSWIAQTSKLDSCLRSWGYGDDPEVIQDTGFDIQFSTKDYNYGCHYGNNDNDDFCHVCNAKDQYHHALSLSITAPDIDYETNIITSLPVVSCSRVCSMDSLKEEDIFTIKVKGYERRTQWWELLEHMVRPTIPELNAEHGFDPARDGVDVCEYFGWPLLEILDPSTGEWMLNGTASQSSGPMSVNTISSQEHDSARMDATTGSVEEVQAGEAPTKTESVSVVRYDISTRVLIVIFIIISIQVVQFLSSFQKHL